MVVPGQKLRALFILSLPDDPLHALAGEGGELPVSVLHNPAPVDSDEGGGGAGAAVVLQNAQLALLLLHLLTKQHHPLLQQTSPLGEVSSWRTKTNKQFASRGRNTAAKMYHTVLDSYQCCGAGAEKQVVERNDRVTLWAMMCGILCTRMLAEGRPFSRSARR